MPIPYRAKIPDSMATVNRPDFQVSVYRTFRRQYTATKRIRPSQPRGAAMLDVTTFAGALVVAVGGIDHGQFRLAL